MVTKGGSNPHRIQAARWKWRGRNWGDRGSRKEEFKPDGVAVGSPRGSLRGQRVSRGAARRGGIWQAVAVTVLGVARAWGCKPRPLPSTGKEKLGSRAPLLAVCRRGVNER